jgi:D-lactate dehydrogenase (cytochrome)
VTVAAMQEALAAGGAWFPPATTFTGACAGGIVATNAAGAATFKYGSTRPWVEALTVVFADGTILTIARGEQRAQDGRFELETRSGRVTIPVPCYTMPDVAKRSAGYHAAAGMDLVDLFVGSEGTLGIVAEVTFRIRRPAPHIALALIPCPSNAHALELTRMLRHASRATWQTGDPRGIDAAAIEYMDRRALAILREDDADTRYNIAIPFGTDVLLLVQLELPADVTTARAYEEIADALDAGADTGLGRFCRLLDEAGVLGDTEIALPGDRRRADALIAIREAVAHGANQRIGLAKRTIDPRIQKVAGDMIVPFERFGEMMDVYRRGFEARGLDFGIWGHISDGNVHPNVLPRSYADVEAGQQAMLEFGREAARLGGCPLAEHGVGRSAVKQALLRQLYGDAGIDDMRAVKRALDPAWKLSPGVIFPRE